MRFVCLGYFEESQWNRLSEGERQTFMDECLGYDEELRAAGHMTGGDALGSVTKAVTVRRGSVTDGPYVETKEQLGGLLYLQAASMEEAVELMRRHPGTRTGGFEIRQVDPSIEALAEARRRKAAQVR